MKKKVISVLALSMLVFAGVASATVNSVTPLPSFFKASVLVPTPFPTPTSSMGPSALLEDPELIRAFIDAFSILDERTQKTSANAWQEISLKNTEKFDPKCVYVVTTPVSSFRVTHVETNELKYYEPWGMGQYQASWISNLKKTILNVDVSHYYDNTVSSSTEKVLKIEKNCEL